MYSGSAAKYGVSPETDVTLKLWKELEADGYPLRDVRVKPCDQTSDRGTQLS
jgi:hypothetical protein